MKHVNDSRGGQGVDPRDDPFARLERSHRRLEEELDALRDAAHRSDASGVRAVCAFFSRQVVRHEADEEASLFPRLAGRGEVELDALLARLAGEHREHEALTARLSSALDAGADASTLIDVAEAIVQAYDAHVRSEEKELFPRARALLSEAERAEIAAEMSARRGR